ncbi:dephospho-CoA kinase [Ekhidna sp.]|uniref:dephospho-CoA kinase n=1 Tax=Ekhidna sp. TaxID=2608089 RepID=UPI0032971696
MPGKPLFIGITGGIGSGKTTVCKIFETLGARTYYADDRAKWLMENDSTLIEKIKSLFGDKAYEQGKLDRKFIAGQVFQNGDLLEQLNGVVHPAVGDDVHQWMIQNQDAKVLLKEAALLFETGSYKSLDKNILVTAPKDVRVSRVVARDKHRTVEDVKAIIAKQMSDDEKAPLSDFIIVNDESQSVIKQVIDIHDQLIIT